VSAPEQIRVVVDTNTLLRAMISERSPSRAVLELLETRKVIVLLSKPVLDEYREILTDPELVERYPILTPKRVELTLRRLRYVGDVYRKVNVRFELPRDPRDAKFIELAITGEADFIITHDNDLLSLPASRTEAGRRFRQRLEVDVMTSADFLKLYRDVLVHFEDWRDSLNE
jgi:putative PIN family toxin of toxin-antitoxin system